MVTAPPEIGATFPVRSVFFVTCQVDGIANVVAPNRTNHNRTAIIIGAGPAGLTAAYELLSNSNIKPIVLEKSDHMGGLSRTVNYKGNRIDIGGHRFFSKSDRVMNWWFQHLLSSR
jgi:NADPH-dependent 2,4-dienoyl-CoA reductase/sulfur reductase-like enzyme